MKIEKLIKGSDEISPLTHTNSVYCPDGINLTTHLEGIEDAVAPNGFLGYEKISHSPSQYFVNNTSKMRRRTTQYSTTPIHLKAGDVIEFDCYCNNTMYALVKLSSTTEAYDVQTTGLIAGSSASPEIKTYTYTAAEDMYVKISCFADYGLTVRKIAKLADNAIDYLKEKIDEASAIDCVKDTGEVISYQEIGSTDYAVIMMYGQSLSVGQESPASFKDDDVEGCYMLEGGVQSTSGSKLVPLGTGAEQSEGITSQSQDPVVSATKAFVNLYRKAHPEDKNTKFIAISMGVGGKSLLLFADESRYSWASTSYMETRVIPCLTALKAIADAEGKTISLCSLIWCQGETDYNVSYVGKTYADWYAATPQNFGGSFDAYKQGLHDLYDDIYANAQEIFGAANQVAPPPFFAYALGGKWIGNAFLTINHATYELADELDTMWIVAPNYPVPDYGGGHLAMNGYRWYGEYIAKAMYYALIKKVDWKPLQPTSVEIVNGNVEVNFDRPVTFDTYTNDECPDYGFVLRQGTAAQLNAAKAASSTEYNVSISSVTLSQDGKKITIVPSTALTADCVEVIYAGAGGTYTSEHFQGSGNVRDYDKWRSLNNYRSDTYDHGNQTNSPYWDIEPLDTGTYDDWDSSTTYSYGDVVKYNGEKCTSLRNSNKNLAPRKSGGAVNVGVAWAPIGTGNSPSAYDPEAPILDETVLSGDGYAFEDEVSVPNIASVFGYTTMKSLLGGDDDGNKVVPFTPIDYRPEDADGNSIVGSKYPMQNWCINFYKRITQ